LLALPNKFPSDPKELINSNSSVNLFRLSNMRLSSLGFLIASWEHRVFITASMLQINPFDQFGVKAGKIAAKSILDQQ
jgi:glucose-6-phosphate isomerase